VAKKKVSHVYLVGQTPGLAGTYMYKETSAGLIPVARFLTPTDAQTFLNDTENTAIVRRVE